jgi:hypothetical protein
MSSPHPRLTGFTPPTPQSAVNHQAKVNEVMSKYAGSGVVQQSAITIQDLVKKMHQGSGLKVI